MKKDWYVEKSHYIFSIINVESLSSNDMFEPVIKQPNSKALEGFTVK